MGAAESHPESGINSQSKCEGGASVRRRRHSNGHHHHHQLRACASCPGRSVSVSSPREFYPPPILHTLCPDFDNQLTIRKASELTQLIAKRRQRVKRMVIEEIAACESARDNEARRDMRDLVATRLFSDSASSTVSSSSGCESLLGESLQSRRVRESTESGILESESRIIESEGGILENSMLKKVGLRKQSRDSGAEMDEDSTTIYEVQGSRQTLNQDVAELSYCNDTETLQNSRQTLNQDVSELSYCNDTETLQNSRQTLNQDVSELSYCNDTETLQNSRQTLNQDVSESPCCKSIQQNHESSTKSSRIEAIKRRQLTRILSWKNPEDSQRVPRVIDLDSDSVDDCVREKPAAKVEHKKHSFKRSLKNFRVRTISTPPGPAMVKTSRNAEKPSTPIFGRSLGREWEVVTVQEMCRRLSLDRLDQMLLPIPDGATTSKVLDEGMIRQVMDILPARAEGYPWVNIYNSESNGFSLNTLYRKMMEWEEEMSPILLVIRDCEDHVFGAIASTALRPSEHFFGTGDSCLLFKFVNDPQTKERQIRSFTWTGDNQYFVKASKDSLAIGAGGGHYGLWLDADLNHGRSLHCDTFDNEPLAGDSEDFNIQFLEAFGFCMI